MANPNSKIHSNRLKTIRKFVDFNYDLRKPLSKYEKQKIKQYYDEIDALTARPYHVYRTQNKTHLKKVQRFSQHEKYLPQLKVAFIPTNGIDTPKIRFNDKGEVIAITEHVSQKYIEFNMENLIKNPINETERVIKKHKSIKAFKIQAGRYEIDRSFSRDKIAEGVNQYTARYSNQDKNNYFGNWLNGVIGYNFRNQSDFEKYSKEKTKNKEDIKRKRYNKKKRDYYHKNK